MNNYVVYSCVYSCAKKIDERSDESFHNSILSALTVWAKQAEEISIGSACIIEEHEDNRHIGSIIYFKCTYPKERQCYCIGSLYKEHSDMFGDKFNNLKTPQEIADFLCNFYG